VAGIMKTKIWILAVSIILIATVIAGIFYFESLLEPSQPDPSPIPSTPGGKLLVDNLSALANGQVSFNVTLDKYEFGIIEAVVVNGERYLWSDGSQKNPTILKDETKQWSIDIGNFEENDSIQVVVEATPEWGSANATVESCTPDGGNQTLLNYVYDYYGGVNLFREGIHVLATSQDPRTLVGEFGVTNDFWKMLLESETINATDQDFISILLSRGNKPTGGYDIQIESFSWLESYPVKFLFQVNFTDPGEGVIVTQALTNPLVLVPIGKLTPGEYNIEVPIVWYILSIDEEGNPIYTQIMTFAPVIWRQSLTINKTEDPTPSTTFEVILNGNEAPDLTVQVDLSNGLTEEETKKIAEVAFIQTIGEKLHRLDTLIFDDNKITAHYTWGYDENDMGHIFDLTANLTTLKITINHCR
jgi:hypothetical protein